MPKSCSAINCSRRSVKGNGLSFFRFPLKDPALLQKWISALRRADWLPNKHTTICSAHFTKDCYQLRPGASHILLKSNAVPSIFDFTSEENDSSNFKPRKCKVNKMPVKAIRKHAEMTNFVLSEHGYSAKVTYESCDNTQTQSKKKKKLLSVNETVHLTNPSGDNTIKIGTKQGRSVAMDMVTNTTIHAENALLPIPISYELQDSSTSVCVQSNVSSQDLKNITYLRESSAESTVSLPNDLDHVLEELEKYSQNPNLIENMLPDKEIPTNKLEERVASHNPPIDTQRQHVICYTTKGFADGKELDCSLKEFKLHRNVRALQQKIRRLNHKVKSITEQMYHLRKEKNASEAAVQMLQHNFNGIAQEIFQNQLTNGSVTKGAERYTQTIKEFALTLYGHSPPAYEYLSGIFHLPHVSCIKAYSSSIKLPENLSLLNYYQDEEVAEVIQSYPFHIPANSCCTVEEIYLEKTE